MAITKPLLPPKRGYVEREDQDGNRYYYLVETYTKTEIIDISKKFIVPESKDQLFEVTVVGAGSGYNSVLGKSSNGEISSITLKLDINDIIDVSIGLAGTSDKSGGTTSFGTYIQANGGSSNNIIKNNAYTIDGILYGVGATEISDAKNGVCVIRYQAPLYN